MLKHSENHRSHRIGWLRAAVMGANDGIVSTASLIIGVAFAHATHETLLLTGVAGLVAGAMSMAAGEYISVSSQADTEAADLRRERLELASDHESELKELTQIYIGRGLKPDLAHQVATQLTSHDALAAHARDELGITDLTSARPIQAAIASAITFSIGALLPLVVVLTAPTELTIHYVAIMSLVFLAMLGALAAKAGGANIWIGTARVTFLGVLAMAATAGIGSLLGVAA
ncbi:MAG: VIT family protein [Bacteroidia bacterium]|nr:VIT family protein [Methylotenera sp.]